MNNGLVQVVIAAGGLGTRVESWAAFLPKEFKPVGGQPGIVRLLEEVTDGGATRAVLVYHPYYETVFAGWAARVLGRGGRAYYRVAAGLPQGTAPVSERLDLRFVAQHGLYADVTSVTNAVPLLRPGPVYVAYADNLYPGINALAMLRAAPTTPEAAVLARPFDPAEAHRRGVITCREHFDARLLMTGLVEKPDHRQVRALLDEHGPARLRLLEGRLRLPRSLVDILPDVSAGCGAGVEPRLSLALAGWSRDHPVQVITTDSHVIDLGVEQL